LGRDAAARSDDDAGKEGVGWPNSAAQAEVPKDNGRAGRHRKGDRKNSHRWPPFVMYGTGRYKVPRFVAFDIVRVDGRQDAISISYSYVSAGFAAPRFRALARV
jgi:hypothetical protein